MSDEGMLTVDLNAFVAGTGSRFDADGEHIFPQQGEVRVREPYGNGASGPGSSAGIPCWDTT